MRMRLLKQNEGQASNVARPLPPADSEPAFISANLSVNGTMTGNVDVMIDGHVQGEIRGRSVSIGENAEVEASLKAYVVDIAGELRGRIEAMTVNVSRNARVDATIFHHELSVEKGAAIKGLRPWRPAADMEQRRESW